MAALSPVQMLRGMSISKAHKLLKIYRMCGSKCCRTIVATNSARDFAKPTPILRKGAVRDILSRRALEVVEYGAGNLRNARHLQLRGHKVSVVEFASTVDRFRRKYNRFAKAGGNIVLNGVRGNRLPRQKYDLALITFVLETICDPDERYGLLRRCKRSLRADGVLVLATRGRRDVLAAENSGVRCSDGYRTSGNTFIRGFNLKELNLMLTNVGFNHIRPLHRDHIRSPELVHVIASQ